jgi:hypothetical protein
MQPGRNIYSRRDVAAVDLPQGERVFLSHRRADKPLTETVADILAELGVHYRFDADDEDTRRAAALGMVGDQALVHAIERGVQHSTRLLGVLSAETTGSWWVPYEIGVGRTSGVPVSFLVLASIRSMQALPEYVRLVANYWSVDELLVWAGDLRAPGARQAPSVAEKHVQALERYVPRSPSTPALRDLAETAVATINRLDEPSVWEVLSLTTTERFDWLPTNGGIVRDVAYDLLAPSAFLLILGEHVPDIERPILQGVYRTFTQHHDLARRAPALPYDPECSGWRTRRYREPASTWLQGLSNEQLSERLTRFFAITGLSGTKRLATREEFKSEFDGVLRGSNEQDRRSLGVLVNPLLGFTPATRPVFKRILEQQRRLYERLAGQ